MGGGGWWVAVVVGGPMIIVTRISLKLPISIGYCLESMKSDLVNSVLHYRFIMKIAWRVFKKFIQKISIKTLH